MMMRLGLGLSALGALLRASEAPKHGALRPYGPVNTWVWSVCLLHLPSCRGHVQRLPSKMASRTTVNIDTRTQELPSPKSPPLRGLSSRKLA